MAHQSLYRKYRPQRFDDVVGQRHITRTLRNAVAEDSVAHAYLFTGPRGTGKTTTARILAKALECEQGPTPDPDDTCEQCRDVTEGRHPDVFELDAASRTQVDTVREEIINRLAYAPTRGRWKVYIIDEVHMLSTHSFNALLKSVEEPPERTVFILCTTHPHKVPETIHSRCQRFDFHRIGADDLVERLAYIADAEGMKVAEGALALIARHAAGGMRDAISTLEQLAAFSGSDISLEDVGGLLGEVDSALLFEVADLIASRDVAGSFRFVARIAATGVDIPEFVREFVGHVRDLYVVSAVGDATGIIETTSSEAARLSGQAKVFGPDRLARVLDMLGELTGELRWSPDPRLALEVALTRLARPHGELTIEALAERVAALEAGINLRAAEYAATAPEAVPAPLPPGDPSPPSKANSSEVEEPAEPSEQTAPPTGEEPVVIEVSRAADSGPLDRAQAKRGWPAVVAEVRKLKAARAAIFDGTEMDVDPDGQTLVIEFPAGAKFPMRQAASPETTQLLKNALAAVFGVAPPFRYQLGRGAVRAPAEEQPVATPTRVGVPPADGGDETTTAPPPGPPAGDVAPPPHDDLERMLADQLGAEIIAEHPHETEREE